MPLGSDHEHHFGTKLDASSPSETPITLPTKSAAGNQFYKGFLRIPKKQFSKGIEMLRVNKQMNKTLEFAIFSVYTHS